MNVEQIDGIITAVFAHRLVVEGAHGKALVDVGPDAGHKLSFAEGDRIIVSGERKPSEIKASSVTLADGSVHTVEKQRLEGKKDDDEGLADPEIALAAVRNDGYTVEGEAKRKPKHFEIVGRKGDGLFKLDVGLDGQIRKATPLDLA